MILFLVGPLFAINYLTLLAAPGMAGGLYLFVRGFRLLARKRLLINTPTSKIRSASLGLLEVSGVATGPYTLPAPITGAPCFLYRTIAWQRSDESKSGEWKKAAEETLHLPFFVDDTTGQLLIEPKGAELDLPTDVRQDFSDTIFSPHATPSVLSFLARHGVEPSNDIRIEESSIRPGSPLFIVGTLAENPAVELRAPVTAPMQGSASARTRMQSSIPVSPPTVVRLSEPGPQLEDFSQQSRIAAALARAGIAGPADWEALANPDQQRPADGNPQLQQISVNADEPSDDDAKSNLSFHHTPPIVLMKGANNPAFLISWRSQRQLVRSLAWKSALMVCCGGGLTLLGLYVLLQQFALI